MRTLPPCPTLSLPGNLPLPGNSSPFRKAFSLLTALDPVCSGNGQETSSFAEPVVRKFVPRFGILDGFKQNSNESILSHMFLGRDRVVKTQALILRIKKNVLSAQVSVYNLAFAAFLFWFSSSGFFKGRNYYLKPL